MWQVQYALCICYVYSVNVFKLGVYITYLQQDMHFTSKISFFLSLFISIIVPDDSIACIQSQYGRTLCISLDLFRTFSYHARPLNPNCTSCGSNQNFHVSEYTWNYKGPQKFILWHFQELQGECNCHFWYIYNVYYWTESIRN